MPPTLALLLGLALAAQSCLDPPVRESVDLRFFANGAVIVTSTVEVDDRADGGNPALKRRIAETRQALLDGTDPWSRRFAALEPAAERFEWEKRLGEVTQAVHRAALADPAELDRFFADAPLTLSWTVRDGVAELAIVPGPAGRASRRERKLVEEALGGWSAAVARYLAATGRLYAYLDERPDRAEACFGKLFSELLPEGAAVPELLPGRESELAEALSAAMAEAIEPLRVADGADASLDELSHRVYDPFPARLTVRPPGPALEVEGFASGNEGEDRALTAEGPGLWTALEGLEGTWIAPDPALVYVRQAKLDANGKSTFDLGGLARQTRRAAEAPKPEEVRKAIEERLEPEPRYRVTFRVDPEAEEEFSWEGR